MNHLKGSEKPVIQILSVDSPHKNCGAPPKKQFVIPCIGNYKRKCSCGYLVFSHIFTTNCLGGNANVSNLLDYVFAPEENVSIKNIVRIITSFYKRKGEVLDGVKATGASDYKFIQRPKAPVPMLSTMTDVKISRPYLTYID